MSSNSVALAPVPDQGVITGMTPPISTTSSSISDTLAGISANLGMNTVNAVVTGTFSALAALGNNLSSSAIYKRYREQEGIYLKNSAEMARRLQLQGDIALRNLRYQHTLAQGTNELAVGAAGGNLSGSNLDKLVQNYKYNSLDERTQQIQTLWNVSDAKTQGFINAFETAAKAQTFAYQQKASAWNALAAFVKGTSQGLLADYRQKQTQEAQREQLGQNTTAALQQISYLYNVPYNPHESRDYSAGLINQKSQDNLAEVTSIDQGTPTSLLDIGELRPKADMYTTSVSDYMQSIIPEASGVSTEFDGQIKSIIQSQLK